MIWKILFRNPPMKRSPGDLHWKFYTVNGDLKASEHHNRTCSASSATLAASDGYTEKFVNFTIELIHRFLRAKSERKKRPKLSNFLTGFWAFLILQLKNLQDIKIHCLTLSSGERSPIGFLKIGIEQSFTLHSSLRWAYRPLVWRIECLKSDFGRKKNLRKLLKPTRCREKGMLFDLNQTNSF